jgi:hypothetical protein
MMKNEEVIYALVDQVVAKMPGDSLEEKARSLGACLLGEHAGRNLDRQECARLREALEEMTAERDRWRLIARRRIVGRKEDM